MKKATKIKMLRISVVNFNPLQTDNHKMTKATKIKMLMISVVNFHLLLTNYHYYVSL